MSPSISHTRKIHLPRWATDIVANPPRSGEGFHFWLFRAALALWKCRRDAAEIAAILENAAAICGRRVSGQEIANAVKNARASALRPGRPQNEVWPAVNHEQREAVIGTDFGLVDLWEASPLRWDHSGSHAEEIIDTIFPGDPLLCVGQTNYCFATLERHKWHGRLAKAQLIVPSPMTARTGFTQDGKESEHTLENTGQRRFQSAASHNRI